MVTAFWPSPPTGSGKTLAAFLCAIDRLTRRGLTGGNDVGRAPGRPDKEGRGVRVLYVSPLKVLGADVERNLRVPWLVSRLRPHGWRSRARTRQASRRVR